MRRESRHHFTRFKGLRLTWLVSAALLVGCRQDEAKNAPLTVEAEAVRITNYAPTFTLTGEIAARVQSELSFRLTGQIIERKVDVGAHVQTGDILARLDPKEQQDDVDAAVAGLQAAKARLQQVSLRFERQKKLLELGFTTRRDYDQAEQDYQTARAGLDSGKAQLDLARDRLAQTVLRAPSSGIVTARGMEIGQVAQAGQSVFTLAQDGPRDVIVNVQEPLFGAGIRGKIEAALVSDPRVQATGEVREVAPAIDPSTGAVRVKIGLASAPSGMPLGATVRVMAHAAPRQLAILPRSALFSDGGKAAVWIVDPQNRAVALRQISIETYENSQILVGSGLRPGEIVVTKGVQLLRPTQIVAVTKETDP